MAARVDEKSSHTVHCHLDAQITKITNTGPKAEGRRDGKDVRADEKKEEAREEDSLCAHKIFLQN